MNSTGLTSVLDGVRMSPEESAARRYSRQAERAAIDGLAEFAQRQGKPLTRTMTKRLQAFLRHEYVEVPPGERIGADHEISERTATNYRRQLVDIGVYLKPAPLAGFTPQFLDFGRLRLRL